MAASATFARFRWNRYMSV